MKTNIELINIDELLESRLEADVDPFVLLSNMDNDFKELVGNAEFVCDYCDRTLPVKTHYHMMWGSGMEQCTDCANNEVKK